MKAPRVAPINAPIMTHIMLPGSPFVGLGDLRVFGPGSIAGWCVLLFEENITLCAVDVLRIYITSPATNDIRPKEFLNLSFVQDHEPPFPEELVPGLGR